MPSSRSGSPTSSTAEPVRPRFGVVSLAVADLKAAQAFYEALGWRGAAGVGAVVFLVGNAVLSLEGQKGMPTDLPIQVLHQVAGRGDVARLLGRVAAAGGRVTAPAAEAPWGAVAGAFADPDGNNWDVAFDPDLPREGIISLCQT